MVLVVLILVLVVVLVVDLVGAGSVKRMGKVSALRVVSEFGVKEYGGSVGK